MTKEELMKRVPGLDEETAEAAVNFLSDDFLELFYDGVLHLPEMEMPEIYVP